VDDGYEYVLKPIRTNFFNAHIMKFKKLGNIRDRILGRNPDRYHRDIDYELALEEILVFIGLMKSETTGWICRVSDEDRKCRLKEWKRYRCSCVPHTQKGKWV